MGAPAVFELSFRPQDRSVHHVRLMVQNFAMLASGDQPFSSRVTVTCAELVENLARRFLATPCTLRLELDPGQLSARAELTVDPHPREEARLGSLLEAANRGSPVEAYTSALVLQGGDQEAILGLARIRYEGQMSLSTRRAGGRTVISASCGGRPAGALSAPRAEPASRYRAPAAPWAEMRASARTEPDRS